MVMLLKSNTLDLCGQIMHLARYFSFGLAKFMFHHSINSKQNVCCTEEQYYFVINHFFYIVYQHLLINLQPMIHLST